MEREHVSLLILSMNTHICAQSSSTKLFVIKHTTLMSTSEVCVCIVVVCSTMICQCICVQRHPLFQWHISSPKSHPSTSLYYYPCISFVSSLSLSLSLSSIQCGGQYLWLRLITTFHHNTWVRGEITISYSVRERVEQLSVHRLYVRQSSSCIQVAP